MKQPIYPVIDSIQFAGIPRHQGYAVSSDGRVWTCKWNRWGFTAAWRPLKATENNKYGRQVVHLGRSGPRYVHHLVLESFVGPRPDESECLHINGDASDNRLANLRWGTRLENMADFRLHGKKKGVKHHGCKLNEDMVRDIRRRAAQGETHQSIADRICVKREAVSKIVRRERWAHVT